MPLSPATRAREIASYGSAYDTLVAGLEKFPAAMWDFRDAQAAGVSASISCISPTARPTAISAAAA